MGTSVAGRQAPPRVSPREPFFSQGRAARLFGVHHSAHARTAASLGAVICSPIGQEYFEHHKMTVILADMLAERGVPCLRFDYSGCGDSEGDLAAQSCDLWLSDIGSMVALLRQKTDVNRVCLCGVRFGGCLAATYGATREIVDKLVLWDPVVNGHEYIADLRRNHKRWLDGAFARPQPVDLAYQSLGFACHPRFCDTARRMNLLSLSSPPADNVLMLQGSRSENAEELSRQLGKLGSAVEVQKFRHVGLPLRPMSAATEWIVE